MAFADLNCIEYAEIQNFNVIGRGSFGTVYKATWKSQQVAIKTFDNAVDKFAIEGEIKQLSRVAHQNIIALYGVGFNEGLICLVMEYAECGSLHDFLHGKAQQPYTASHAMSWARQCSEAVAYLHNVKPKPLIHRDLKPPNLLLVNMCRDLKICDFGTVVDQKTNMTNNMGSAAWMAPEVFKSVKYTEKCDVFSWGIILWEVLSRQQPFKEFSLSYAILWQVSKGARPPPIENCPKPIEKLMTRCWDGNPDKRPTMEEVVETMRIFCKFFPGEDIPLKKVFVDNSSSYSDERDEYSSTGTMTESQYTNTSDEITPTGSENPQTKSTLNDVFRLEPSSETVQRNAQIRRQFEQLASSNAKYQKPISLETNPNAWDLDQSLLLHESKSDGKDRLTVTDTKPVHLSDENNEDDALAAMLDKDLQPPPPINNNPVSEEIHQQHIILTKKYLTLNERRVYANQRKAELLSGMDSIGKKNREEILKKRKEIAELLAIKTNLLEQFKRNNRNNLPNELHNSSNVSQQEPTSPNSENRADEGWVFIQQSPQS